MLSRRQGENVVHKSSFFKSTKGLKKRNKTEKEHMFTRQILSIEKERPTVYVEQRKPEIDGGYKKRQMEMQSKRVFLQENQRKSNESKN